MDYRNANRNPRVALRAAGATEEECCFLVGDRTTGGRWSGRRVELNAFSSPRLIEFIEHKFREVGVAKVVPNGETLEAAYRCAWAAAEIQKAVDEAVARVSARPAPPAPPDLAAEVARAVEGTDKPWDDALADIVRTARAQRGGT